MSRSIADAIESGLEALAGMQAADGAFPLWTGTNRWTRCGPLFATAYVMMGAGYSFTDHGQPVHEPARMTFALRKSADGWKIAGWTCTGPHGLPGDAPAPHAY